MNKFENAKLDFGCICESVQLIYMYIVIWKGYPEVDNWQSGNWEILKCTYIYCDNMSAEVLAEIKERFGGKWKVDRSECFEDFLREMGLYNIRIYIVMSSLSWT